MQRLRSVGVLRKTWLSLEHAPSSMLAARAKVRLRLCRMMLVEILVYELEALELEALKRYAPSLLDVLWRGRHAFWTKVS